MNQAATIDPTATLSPPRRAAGVAVANEPAVTVGALTGVVDAGLILLFAFVSDFSAEQQAAVLAFATPFVALLGGLLTRSRVTPVAKLVATSSAGQAGVTPAVQT